MKVQGQVMCRELADSDLRGSDRRPHTALFLLLRWIGKHQSEYVRIEPCASDGLAHMVVPDGYEDLISEIEAGAQVCNALFMLYTADSAPQADHDRAVMETHLAAYWERCAHPVPIPRGAPRS
jgi:hypothetical protein